MNRKTTDYAPYGEKELQALITEPWTVSDDPYKIYAAYALSALYDMVFPDFYPEDRLKVPGFIWGLPVPVRIVARLVRDLETDFNDAAENHKPVRIWGRSSTIRYPKRYDPSRLHDIFNFERQNDEYIISKDGIMNLADKLSDGHIGCDDPKAQAAFNRTYLRQIVMLAEDDANGGWDKLTDMEVVLYCWAMFHNKTQSEKFDVFKYEYADYIYVPDKEILGCLSSKSQPRQIPLGIHGFSADKVKAWNIAHGQKSYASEIPKEEADDYWFGTALKGTFKPSSQR